MARILIQQEQGPQEVKIGGESKWLCKCGLSKNQPYCDGSHKKTLDEKEGELYEYNPDGTRTEIVITKK